MYNISCCVVLDFTNVSLNYRLLVDRVLHLASLNKNNSILNFYWLLTGIYTIIDVFTIL